MAGPYAPTLNRILAALPKADSELLLPHLEQVPLPVGKVFQDPGREQTHVFFPISGALSLFQLMESGIYEQIATVGHEGAVGITPLVSGEKISTRAVVQSPGFAYRIKSGTLKEELARGGAMRHLLRNYLAALVAQEKQTKACNRLHAVEQQLCRWLLLGMDRHASNEMTIAAVSDILGVGRKGVTEAVTSLEAAGLISCRAGTITVIDRPKLEERVCECYGLVRQEIHRFLSSVNTSS